MEGREDGRSEETGEKASDQGEGFEGGENGRRTTRQPGSGGFEERRRRTGQRGGALIDAVVSLFHATVRAGWVKFCLTNLNFQN